MKYYIALLPLAVTLASCATNSGPREISSNYENVAALYLQAESKVNIGDPKEKVLAVIEPTQAALPWNAKKGPKRYRKSGVNVEIFYFRSAHIADGLMTDNEYTPYIFNNNILVGTGWEVMNDHGVVDSEQRAGNTQSTTTVNQQVVVVY